MDLGSLWMAIHDIQSDTSGKPNYQLDLQVPEKTTSSTGQEFQDKTSKGSEVENIEKYRINRPMREIIYVKIIRQESQKRKCIETEQTRATE